MKCPYCKGEMAEGYLIGERYSIKWIQKGQKLVLRTWVKNGLDVGSDAKLGRANTHSFLCKSCNKIIVDLNNL